MSLKLALAVFFAFFVSLGNESCPFLAQSHAQMNTIYKIDTTKKQTNEVAAVKYIQLSGKVLSAERKKQAIRASVYIKALRINTVTDEKGYFSFHVPENFGEDLVIVFSANDAQTLTKTLKKEDFSVFQKVFLTKKQK